jgi:hypothetical protein
MKKTKLFILLNSFDSKDFDEFELYLLSPFHNKNKPLSTIFHIIKEKKDLLIQENYLKLIQIISKRTDYPISTIKKLFSILGEAILDYYKVKSVLSDDMYSRISLNNYLLKNKEHRTLEQLQSSLDQEFNARAKISNEDYYKLFLHKLNMYSASVVNLKYQNNKDVEKRLQLMKDAGLYLSLYTLIQMTLLYANYTLDLIDSGLDEIKGCCFPLKESFSSNEAYIKNSNNKLIINVFELYYNAFLCYENISNKTYYRKYKGLFYSQIDNLDKESLYINYNLLLGYCSISQRIIDADKFFYEEELDLLTFNVEKGLYKNELTSNMSPITYRNYVILCLDIMNMNKLKLFIDNYSTELNLSERVDMINYALTHYYYGTGNNKKALKYLNSVDIKKFLYKYDLLNLEIKIYYDRGDFMSLDRVFHNYRETIKKDKILTKYDKVRILIFVKYFSELIRIIRSPESNDILFSLEYLLDHVQKENSFIMKKWMIEKIEHKIESIKKRKQPACFN